MIIRERECWPWLGCEQQAGKRKEIGGDDHGGGTRGEGWRRKCCRGQLGLVIAVGEGGGSNGFSEKGNSEVVVVIIVEGDLSSGCR